MKIDLLPTGAAAVCGGCAVAFGQPVLAFMATNVELACGVAAAAILTGAAWAGMPRRRRPDPLPDLGTFSPPCRAETGSKRTESVAGRIRV